MKTAKMIKDISENYNGDARLFKLSTPLDGNEFVVVSAVEAPFDTLSPETYIFPADSNGVVTDWGELEGSYQGGMSHQEALARAGYELIQQMD